MKNFFVVLFLLFSTFPSKLSSNFSSSYPIEFICGKISINGNKSISTEKILSLIKTRVGLEIDSSMLQQDVENILSLYENNGYPFASVSIKNISTYFDNGEDKVALELEINEGQIVYIEQYSIEGNKETNNDVVLRELRMNKGELYNQTKINRAEKSLRRLNIFSSVSEPQLFLNNDGGNLLIKVQEGSFNNFNGILGYIPSANNQSGIVTGQIDVSMRNLFGSARKAAIHWQRENELTQEISLKYSEPWLFNIPLTANIGFAQRKQDSTYVKRITEFNTEFSFDENFSLGTIFSYEQTLPSLTISSSIFSNQIVTAGIQAQYDSRDDFFSATEGGLYNIQTEWGNKTISSSN